MDQEMYWHMSVDDPHPVIERGIALHKMIRLATLALGGEGWLNFMGNEFGHPEWIDFPREGNGWSYHYCRRQWSLVDDPALKYAWLARFDRSMMSLAAEFRLLDAPPAQCLHLDPDAKMIVAMRAGLLFVFNFSVAASVFGHAVATGDGVVRRVVLDSDDASFGGHGRMDATVEHPVDDQGVMRIYSPCRSAQVYAPAI
jgi:1,4-alpha-glucan branching enzyme